MSCVAGLPSSVSDASFLMVFPEFNDAGRFPAGQRMFWLNLALDVLPECRWGDYYEMGVYLFVAHHLSLFAPNQRAARRGASPGMAGPTGLITGKSVGGVSVSFDTGSVTYQNAGQWNMTTYGIRFYSLIQMVGAGAVQIGYGPFPSSGSAFTNLSMVGDRLPGFGGLLGV